MTSFYILKFLKIETCQKNIQAVTCNLGLRFSDLKTLLNRLKIRDNGENEFYSIIWDKLIVYSIVMRFKENRITDL